MTYAGIQMFMEKLNQLINCNDVPFFNHPDIIHERPQFQLLYDELGSMIQTLFIDQYQDLEKVSDLKKRFTEAAEEAQYIVNLFLYGVHIRNNGPSPTSEYLNPFLNLDNILISFNSVKVELTRMIVDSMNMAERTLYQSTPAPISISRNSQGSLDEIFVGLDRDAELIRDKLVGDQKNLDVVSIVGMGVIGKTTLATKVFNDGYVKYHFYVRVWVTVSQTYDKRAVLTQILESICGQLDVQNANDSRLRELVHKNLMGNRYLIVIDDIWHIEAWDDLKVFFPHDNNGSRILLTSRQTEVAKHANSDGLIHHLGYLNKEKGWELLCQKVFQGVLAKKSCSEEFWVEIAHRTSSYIVGDQNGCMETLGLSYNHLPLHLRECFLYLGGFREDYMFEVQWLIWVWVAEGFIQQDGNRSLEDIAKGYMVDLIDRNLVMVAHRSSSNGGVKACKVHDLIRELCLEKAKQEKFILQTERLILSPQFSNDITQPYKPVRMFINKESIGPCFAYLSAKSCRSIVCFSDCRSLSNDITKYLCSFVLLRVLDLQKCNLDDFPKGMESLVHLRYLVIWKVSEGFPSSICNLWNLRTLVYITTNMCTSLPSNISDLVNLRHLWSYLPLYFRGKFKKSFYLPSIEKPMNLQTISGVELGDGVDNFQNCFPYIKELTCTTYSDEQNDFKSLTYLEILKLTSFYGIVGRITFPTTLKLLTLVGCYLPWSEMSIIQSLPNLQVLKLHRSAFEGNCWNTDELEFPQLKFLSLMQLDIQLWEAYSTSFPCLRQLEITKCSNLEEISLEIGDIPTLELIKIKVCRPSVGESVRRIEQEQHELGNFHLKIHIFEDY
ncbi:putative P-loop containing nucleoside triphosphate hydrolase, leucine-rich repeat domain superfamily [Helianthus debilis subsp. tardiflorus]